MANENFKRDDNHVPVLGVITNDSDQETRMLRADPLTGYLQTDAPLAPTAVQFELLTAVIETNNKLLRMNNEYLFALTDDRIGEADIEIAKE